MDETYESDFFSKWNPETDMIKKVLSNLINCLREQIVSSINAYLNNAILLISSMLITRNFTNSIFRKI